MKQISFFIPLLGTLLLSGCESIVHRQVYLLV